MEKQTVVHGTFVIERHYPAQPKRLFAAFADPATKQRWFVGNNKVEAFEVDFRAGGRERVVFRMDPRSPIGAARLTNEGVFLDIVPDRRIVSTSTMAREDQRISASLLTVELLPAANGTDLILTHQGAFFEGADGPQMREDGWRQLLGNLAEALAHS
jgi:uncharacterized protein YndB with AHSA1/START domain